MYAITIEEIVARLRARRSGKTFIATFINECHVQDMIPVVQGEWIYEKGFTADTWECDQCHEAQTNKSKYCPSCGAKMEKEST